ncbi:MAG: hypothetical protein ABIY70_25620 [Capsulimonas sp.]|uniref:hypothetical protein n=1 Tax=Capsulimonas sp. TaxID=2494211 RepID=UPI003265849C
MTITVPTIIERALTVEVARRGTTPDLLAEEILITSLSAVDDEDSLSPNPNEILNDLIAKAQTLELPPASPTASNTQFGEAIVAKYRKQGFTL